MITLLDILFKMDVVVLFALLLGAVWSAVLPGSRIWPPPGKGSWQHWLTWVFFCLAFTLNAVLFFLDWDSWAFRGSLRFVLGIPLSLLGALLVTWGIRTLGVQNTSGLRDGFSASGPYKFTRNPQYLGDMALFVGLSLIANSLYLWIVHILMIIVFIIAPLAEETWLEEQYRDEYIKYKRGTSRFL